MAIMKLLTLATSVSIVLIISKFPIALGDGIGGPNNPPVERSAQVAKKIGHVMAKQKNEKGPKEWFRIISGLDESAAVPDEKEDFSSTDVVWYRNPCNSTTCWHASYKWYGRYKKQLKSQHFLRSPNLDGQNYCLAVDHPCCSASNKGNDCKGFPSEASYTVSVVPCAVQVSGNNRRTVRTVDKKTCQYWKYINSMQPGVSGASGALQSRASVLKGKWCISNEGVTEPHSENIRAHVTKCIVPTPPEQQVDLVDWPPTSI